jgi:hypothetical protein
VEPVFARITKVDENTREVTGRAVQSVVDRENEIFDYPSSKPEFQKWSAEVFQDTEGKSYGNVRAMHGNVCAGKLSNINYEDAEEAIDVTAKVIDDNEWKKVTSGCYSGFSIGGRYSRKWSDILNGKTVTRYTAVPSEISLVDRPCVPTAKFHFFKRDGSVDDVAFKGFTPPATATSGVQDYDLEGERLKKPPAAKREFTQAQRDSAADSGAAMEDGSFPIKNTSDLKNAIQAHGRAKNKAKAKAHIISRAKALGATSELPDDWKSGGAEKGCGGDLGDEDSRRQAANEAQANKSDDGDLEKYSEDQPRDAQGRFGSGGGSGRSAALETSAGRSAEASRLADKALTGLKAANRDGGNHPWEEKHVSLAHSASLATDRAERTGKAEDHKSAAAAHFAVGRHFSEGHKEGGWNSDAGAHSALMSAHSDRDHSNKLLITSLDEDGLQKFWDQHASVLKSGVLVKGIHDIAGLGNLIVQLQQITDAASQALKVEGDTTKVPEALREEASRLLGVLSDMTSKESHEGHEGKTVEVVMDHAEPVMDPGLYRADVGEFAKALRDSLFPELKKLGARNSAKDLETIQKVHDASCELGAACAPGSQSDQSTETTKMATVSKGGIAANAISTEGNKRGASVTDPSFPAESKNAAEDDKVASDTGAEKSKPRTDEEANDFANGKGKKSEKRKARADKAHDNENENEDEDENDEDEEDEEPAKKPAKAKKSFDADDLAKAVAAGVAAAMTQMSKGESTVIPRVAPNLMAVGKDGVVGKLQSIDLDSLRKSVQPAAGAPLSKWSPELDYRDQPTGRMVGDNDTATLIKAIHADPRFRIQETLLLK